MSQFIRFFLSFCMFYAVDPEAPGDVQDDDQQTDGGGENETVDAGEAAWDAIQSGDVEQETDAQQESAETDAEKAAKTEQENQEQGQDQQVSDSDKSITDDDLKPLEGAKASTQERFQKITEGYKSEKQRADTLAEENSRYKESFDSLRQLGFNDEAAANDLVEFSNYRTVLASGNVEQFQQIMSAQIKQFQDMHGKPVQIGGSIINDHPDLKQKLENMEIDEPTALEVARARNLQNRASRETQRQNEQVQASQQSQQVINDAVGQVVSMEEEWRKTDPDFNAILPELKEAITEIRTKFHPTQWPSAIEMQYKTIKKALALRETQNRQTTPLRGNSHMSGNRQPGSMQEAVLMEMGMSE
jgi:hypothetical protein